MAIKVLKEAGFDKDDHILTLIHRGTTTLGEVRVRDTDGKFITFSNPLPIATALDLIRCSHNGDVVSGKIRASRVMPKTEQVLAALARVYLVEHLV